MFGYTELKVQGSMPNAFLIVFQNSGFIDVVELALQEMGFALQKRYRGGLNIDTRRNAFLVLADGELGSKAVGFHFLLHLLRFHPTILLVDGCFLNESMEFSALVIKILTSPLHVVSLTTDVADGVHAIEKGNG